MRQQWSYIEFLFIDEISMILYEMLCMVDSRLKQLKNSEVLLFRGVNVLVVLGDLMQLPPLQRLQIFDQPLGWRQLHIFDDYYRRSNCRRICDSKEMSPS